MRKKTPNRGFKLTEEKMAAATEVKTGAKIPVSFSGVYSISEGKTRQYSPAANKLVSIGSGTLLDNVPLIDSPSPSQETGAVFIAGTVFSNTAARKITMSDFSFSTNISSGVTSGMLSAIASIWHARAGTSVYRKSELSGSVQFTSTKGGTAATFVDKSGKSLVLLDKDRYFVGITFPSVPTSPSPSDIGYAFEIAMSIQ